MTTMSSSGTHHTASSTLDPAPGRGRAPAATGAGASLRERKKLRTRQAIRESAYRLITEQGYHNTTVEQIAEDAEVSPSTVFRYFATKEEIVLTAEHDALMEQALLERPASEPPLVAVREAITGSMRGKYQDIPAELMQRLQLITQVPELRAQMHAIMDRNAEMLRRALAERTGRPEDDLELKVVASAVCGALTHVIFDWVERDQQEDLMETIERALSVLERGLTL
jgi:AcrR family transcriptional regulator